jgi:hypothetical protein
MKYIFGLLALIVIAVGAWYAIGSGPMQPATVTDEQGMDFGQETAPEVLWHNASADDIRVDAPLANARLGRTFTLTGAARGGWYFEASFPVEVVDGNGNQLLIMPVPADGEWMTEEFVPFSTQVAIPGSYAGPARLILRRDNASGLPEHDKSVSIPVTIE